MENGLATATATALIAVAGLLTTIVFSFLQRRDSIRAHHREQLHRHSAALASGSPAERAAAIAATTDQVSVRYLATSARRIILTALHYEEDPLIVYRGLQGLADPTGRQSALSELLAINRELWKGLLDYFGHQCVTPAATADNLGTYLLGLSRNQQLVSHLLHHQDVSGLDFSQTFYPNLQAPSARFRRCDFSNSFVHYGNMRDAQFDSCDFTRTVLIGTYLEGATFHGNVFRDVVSLGADPRNATRRPVNGAGGGVPEGLVSTSAATSFIWAVEQSWFGHWVGPESGGPVQAFSALWQTDSGRQVTAKVEFLNERQLRRSDSSDGNDGVYDISQTRQLDALRGVTLLGGTRMLRSGIPDLWYGIWWTRIPSPATPPSHDRLLTSPSPQS